jgi:hypothetical protein
VLKTCPAPWSCNARATTADVPALTAVAVAIGTPSDTVSSMISAACSATAPRTSTSFTPSTAARPAASTSTPTSPTSPRPGAIIPGVSSPSPSASLPKTAYPTAPPRGTSGVTIVSLSPSPRSRTGSRPREKKIAAGIETDYLDWALADFSGYLAADELYDGPFCVLSAVDPHRQRRLLYEVLDHDPTRADILWFLARVKDQISARQRAVLGITTDGSSLYPQPIALLFGNIPHQVCVFHILKELTKAVLRVLAQLRKRLAAQAPQLPRGRPKNTRVSQRLHRKAQAIGQRVAALFEHRHLFVRRHLSAAERARLQQLLRCGRPLRAVRAIMDEVYRLFDRRCRTDTALAKLTCLRRRVRRYRSLGKTLDKLQSPNLEKALTFLDEELLPATSNAVERGNRRHRKMQKTVYRVRSHASLVGRMALDLQRDQQAGDRSSTMGCLHEERG